MNDVALLPVIVIAMLLIGAAAGGVEAGPAAAEQGAELLRAEIGRDLLGLFLLGPARRMIGQPKSRLPERRVANDLAVGAGKEGAVREERPKSREETPRKGYEKRTSSSARSFNIHCIAQCARSFSAVRQSVK